MILYSSAKSVKAQDAETRIVGIRRLTVEMVDACDAGKPQPFHKMDIKDMQDDAALMACEIEIDWESLDNPDYRSDFVQTLEKGVSWVPELENLYTKLSKGESVVFPDKESPLPFDELEHFQNVVAEELFSAYVLREVYHKFQMVERVMALDNG